MVDIRLIKIKPEMTTPSYAHEGDAGIDLRSSVDAVIKPGDTRTIETGTMMAIPSGYAGLVWDKSGIASKHSVHTMSGVIDSGYRGEIKIVMINLGHSDFDIKKDMKIAQLLIQPVATANIRVVDKLDETTRGESGFGSTGKY
jgi:dUTP pyrophosphatase